MTVLWAGLEYIGLHLPNAKFLILFSGRIHLYLIVFYIIIVFNFFLIINLRWELIY